MTTPIILTLIDHYLPGFKFGGPIRTVANIVEQLGDDVDFRIVTTDRDLQDTVPYPDVTVDNWNTVGKAQVFYASPAQRSLRNFRRLIQDTQYDMLYLNSFFSPLFSIYPMILNRFRLIPPRPVVLAPRGEFSPGALEIRFPKKRSFIEFSKVLQLYKGITWHASSDMEQKDIERWFPCQSKRGNLNHIQIALDLSPQYSAMQKKSTTLIKKPGSLRVVFLSRISPKKNLDFALNLLKGICGDISFDIYGPVDRDKEYWETCKNIILEMPDHITVQHKGVVEHNQVRDIFAQYHAFFLPTRGENFGHVIMESLSAGCPVILSDQTPWKDLEEKQSGWNIPLDQPERYQTVLAQLVAMDQDQWQIHVQHTLEHAMQAANNQEVLEQNRRLFLRTQS